MRKLIKYLVSAKLVYVVVGFLIGAIVTDKINGKIYTDKLHNSFDFGTLIFAYAERPDYCPECNYEFHYLFNFTQEELRDFINDYLGERSFFQ